MSVQASASAYVGGGGQSGGRVSAQEGLCVMGLGVCKSGDAYNVGFASKDEWIKRARCGPSARLS